MPYIKYNGKLYAKCDACGYISRYSRKDDTDLPQGWGGDRNYLRCTKCDIECCEAEEEQALWNAINS